MIVLETTRRDLNKLEIAWYFDSCCLFIFTLECWRGTKKEHHFLWENYDFDRTAKATERQGRETWAHATQLSSIQMSDHVTFQNSVQPSTLLKRRARRSQPLQARKRKILAILSNYCSKSFIIFIRVMSLTNMFLRNLQNVTFWRATRCGLANNCSKTPKITVK